MGYTATCRIGLPQKLDQQVAGQDVFTGETTYVERGQTVSDEMLAAHGQGPDNVQYLVEGGSLVPEGTPLVDETPADEQAGVTQ